MSDVSYAGPLNQWLAQAPPQPPPRVFGKSLAELLGPYLGNGKPPPAPNESGKISSPDFTVPPPGLRPRPSDAFVPNLGAAKSIAAGAVEPFGQLGRVMTGTSQDVPMDVAGAAMGLAPAGRAGKALKAGAESAAEHILGAAVTGTNGKVFSAPNHLLAMEKAASEMGVPMEDIHSHLEPDVGRFITSHGRMLDRMQAGKILTGKDEHPIFAEELPKTGTLSDFITAYHGSPHDFDQFDLSKVGTGEGAQAYGHGLYFAENEKVAKSYKGTVPNGLGPLNIRNMWTPAELPSGKGNMYQVAIKAPPEHFLDWDKPLSEQSPAALEKLKTVVRPDPGRTVEDWIKHSPGAEQRLREAGIPGIKYLDQGSRKKAEGTRNYVVFDDKLVDVIKKYGIAGIGALPAMNAYHYQDKGS